MKKEFVTLKGIAQESKAGLVVNGTLLEGLPVADVEKYRGKHIAVTGVIQENKCMEEIKKTGVQMQCFGGPYLVEIQSVKIINE